MQLTDKEWIEHFENTARMASDVAYIKEAIEGNGDPGLLQRVDVVEKSIAAQKNKVMGFSTAFAVIGTVGSHWLIAKLAKYFPGMFS